MLPMGYAPVREEIPACEFTMSIPAPGVADQWRAAMPVARVFWERVATDTRVSGEFRAIAANNAAMLVTA
jgi:hypothetical protein